MDTVLRILKKKLGRQVTSTRKLGVRYDQSENKFKYNTEGELEDIEMRTKGETNNQRMARVCKVAMNSINRDLEFTVESQEDFSREQLPTLDFAVWQEENKTLNWTYYQ